MRSGLLIAVLAALTPACLLSLDGLSGGNGATTPDGGATSSLDGASGADGSVGTTDGTIATDGASDAAPSACDLTKPFGTPAPMTKLNSPSNENSARLSGDGLTVYFESDRGGGQGGYDVWVATRSSVDADFGAPVPLAGVNGPNDDFDPCISPDGLTLIVSQKGITDQDLFTWTRADLTATFGNRTAIAAANSADDEVQPYLTSTGTLAFARESFINGGIFFANGVLGAFTGATAQSALNTTGANGFPVLSNDGLTIYFASTRAGGAGGEDIWVAKRASTADGFGAATTIAELNTANDDVPSYLSADGCSLYLGSTRSTGTGGADIYVATKPQ